MSTEVVIFTLVVGLANALFRYLPLRPRPDHCAGWLYRHPSCLSPVVPGHLREGVSLCLIPAAVSPPGWQHRLPSAGRSLQPRDTNS